MRRFIIPTLGALLFFLLLGTSAFAYIAYTNINCTLESKNGCVLGVNNTPIVQEKPVIDIKEIPTVAPYHSPTSVPVYSPVKQNNSDPIINCIGQYSTHQVTKSVCESHTDCPDGRGGFTWQTLKSCEEKWKGIAGEYKKATEDYTKAVLENISLKNQEFNTNLKSQLQTTPIPTVSFDDPEYERRQRELSKKGLQELKDLMPPIPPTATPQIMGGPWNWH